MAGFSDTENVQKLTRIPEKAGETPHSSGQIGTVEVGEEAAKEAYDQACGVVEPWLFRESIYLGA